MAQEMSNEAFDAAWNCWYKTRILGGSASMWCDAPVEWDTRIVHLMDKAVEAALDMTAVTKTNESNRKE